MTAPSTAPRGEHPGRPGTRWNTALVWSGEQLADDTTPAPRPNRETRRAAKRANRPKEPTMTNSEQTRPATPEEDISILYKRVARLNDKVSALLDPQWGTKHRILPAGHPLRVEPDAKEQGAPTDWQAIAQQRERELKTVGEARHRAETERDQMHATLADILSHFVHKGHPGEPCLQAGWIRVRTVERWRAALNGNAPAADGSRP